MSVPMSGTTRCSLVEVAMLKVFLGFLLTAIDSASRTEITAIAFTADGHIFAGDKWGDIRRWRLKDAEQTGPTMKANGTIESAVVSNDGQWLVTGDDGRRGIVWDARTHEKAQEATEHTHFVYAVDISSDSMRFASGSCDKTTRIFSIATGVRLIPPIQHARAVVGLRFSPSGDQLVTATYNECVCIYNSHTGDRLFEVPVGVMHTPTTPFAWSSDGRELFVVSPGKITRLSTSKSSSSEWWIHTNSTRASIVADGQFIACAAGSSVSLWDATSNEQVGQVVENGPDILCITLSPHRELLACGHGNRISVYRLGKILPDHYVRVHFLMSLCLILNLSFFKYLLVVSSITSSTSCILPSHLNSGVWYITSSTQAKNCRSVARSHLFRGSAR